MTRHLNRREFLGALAGGVSAGLVAAACEPSASGDPRPRTGIGSAAAHPIGVQLYTVRRLLAEEPERTLAALAGIGYAEVELAGLHGLEPAAFRRLLDATGLRAPAGHVGLAQLGTDRDRTFEAAATLGHEFVVVPWIDERDRTPDGYRRVAEALNRAGEAAARAGLRVAYHNHDFEFRAVDGVVPYDLLLAETDPELVALELDLFWIRRGGRDPLAYFEQYPGRFPLVHVKDMDAGGRMVDVGAGTIDFARVVGAAHRAGIRHYFVEHDDPAAPLEFARASYAHMRSLLE